MVLALQPFHPGPGKVPAWPGSRGDESSPAGKPARLIPSPKLQKEREQRTDLKVREVDLGYVTTDVRYPEELRTLVTGLPRKEVIQPHLPVRLPCYDLAPITGLTLGGYPPCGLAHRLRVLPTFVA